MPSTTTISWMPILLALTTLYLPSLAVPTRSRCHCTILSAQDPVASSSLLLSRSQSPDRCANLGPSLEYFRHTAPEIYESYFPRSATPTTEDLKPMSTAVLLELAAKNGYTKYATVAPSAPTQRPGERIVCLSEPEAWTEFRGSRSSLFSLQVIVAMIFFACIAESFSLLYDWLSAQQKKRREQAVRLSGSEQRLRAYSVPELTLDNGSEKGLHPPPIIRDQMFSPGLEKKKQAYTILDQQPCVPSHKHTPSLAYSHTIDDVYNDDDDEMNRPVL